MKKCPKCNKMYDDTWEVCLECRTPLLGLPKETEAYKQGKCIKCGEKRLSHSWYCLKCGLDMHEAEIEKEAKQFLSKNYDKTYFDKCPYCREEYKDRKNHIENCKKRPKTPNYFEEMAYYDEKMRKILIEDALVFLYKNLEKDKLL